MKQVLRNGDIVTGEVTGMLGKSKVVIWRDRELRQRQLRKTEHTVQQTSDSKIHCSRERLVGLGQTQGNPNNGLMLGRRILAER